MFRPLVPIGRGWKIALGISFFLLFIGIWGAATWGGWVGKLFLRDPWETLVTGWNLFYAHDYHIDVGVTVWRVVGGFIVAALIGVPLGILMGAYKPIEAFFEPFISFARYLPASAFIPLLMVWAGIGERSKMAIIFIGAFFPLVLMVAVIVSSTRRDLVEAAYTLGARPGGIVRRVLLPASAPQIAESLRLVLGWAWTYVIVAEYIAADRGIGKTIIDSQALAQTDQIIFGIVVIGLIGLVSDYLFKTVNQKLFPWSLA